MIIAEGEIVETKEPTSFDIPEIMKELRAPDEIVTKEVVLRSGEKVKMGFSLYKPTQEAIRKAGTTNNNNVLC